MRLIYVRHGETDINLREVAGERVADDDAPLNAVGVEQAKKVALRLKDEKVDVNFTSPLRRAVETAKEIAKFHDVPVIMRRKLSERVTGAIENEYWHELYDFDKKSGGRGVETVRDFFDRVYKEVDYIMGSGYQNPIVVSHGGVFHAVRAYYNGLEWKGNLRVDHIGNCEFRVFEDSVQRFEKSKEV